MRLKLIMLIQIFFRENKMFSFFIILNIIASQAVFSQQIPEKKLLVDIANLNGGTVSEIFLENEYIPLENTKESEVNRVDKVLETKDNYLILDTKKPGKIFIFDKQGKFVRKIKEIPGKKTTADGFRNLWLDEAKNEIISEVFSTIDGLNLIYFDLNGNFLRSKKQPHGDRDLYYINQNIFAGVSSYYQSGDLNKKDRPNFHLSFYKDGKMIKQYFPIDTAILNLDLDDIIYRPSGIDVTDPAFLFVNTASYKVFNVNEKGINAIYNIVLPLKNTLPADFMTNKAHQGKRYQMASANKDLVYGFQNLYKLKNWLFFSANHVNDDDLIMYNLQTSSAIELRHVQGDASNAYLPVFLFEGLVGVSHQNIYTTLSAAELFQSKTDMSAKNPAYSKLLSDFFAKSSRLSNPVLVRLKLKGDF